MKPKETIPTGKSKLVTRSEYSKIKYNFKIKIFYCENNALNNALLLFNNRPAVDMIELFNKPSKIIK